MLLFLPRKSQCVSVMAVYSYAISVYSINFACVLSKHCLVHVNYVCVSSDYCVVCDYVLYFMF